MKSRKSHILILTPGFPKDESDFNCIPPLQEFLLKFKSLYPSARISVMAFQYPYRNTQYLWNGINIFPMAGKNKVYMKPLVWLRAIETAKNLNKENQVEVIHSLWLGECAMIGNVLSKKFNCEHICTLMGQDVKASNWYLKLLKQGEIKFVALSKNQADLFSRLTKRNVDEIIHWGIDDQEFGNNERDIDLLGVGSLLPLKNYSLLIEVVEKASIIHPGIRCKIVGAGPELKRLKQMTEEKGLTNSIEFTGLLSRREIFRLMQRSKIFVHPSKFEGSGFVFAEALVNGMNIVSFNVGYAHPHPKWFIASDETDFVRITKELLNKQLNFEPVNLFPLQETVDKYFTLYNS